MKLHIAHITALVAVLAISSVELSAQTDRRDVRHGNRDFKKENWKEADIDYRKAIVKDSLSFAANYNLASTLYRQGDMEQAAKSMERIQDIAPSSERSADYFYNRGDIALASQDYKTAVDAFRTALVINPNDMDAKENYIYARKKLEEQQDNNDQDQNKQDQDQNKDQNNKDNQNQDNKDNQDRENNQDDNDRDNQDQNNRGQSGQDNSQPKITPQAAQQMLQAIQAKEKETQDKVNKEKAKALKSRQKEKNW